MKELLSKIFGGRVFKDYQIVLAGGILIYVGFYIYKSRLELKKLKQEIAVTDKKLKKEQPEMYRNFGIKC